MPKTERIEVICLNCGKTWMGKASARRWKCTQCNSTRVRPVSEMENQSSHENSTGIHVNSDVKNEGEKFSQDVKSEGSDSGENPEKDVTDELIDEILSDEKDKKEAKKAKKGKEKEESSIPGWLLLIPLLVIGLLWFLSGLRRRESEDADELEEYGEYELSAFG